MVAAGGGGVEASKGRRCGLPAGMLKEAGCPLKPCVTFL